MNNRSGKHPRKNGKQDHTFANGVLRQINGRFEKKHIAGDNAGCDVGNCNTSDGVLRVERSDSTEVKHLKELLMTNIELIQQQQELLMAKDQEIEKIASERDSLRCRLERMERRMSLARQPTTTTTATSPLQPPPPESPPPPKTEEVAARSPHSSPVHQTPASLDAAPTSPAVMNGPSTEAPAEHKPLEQRACRGRSTPRFPESPAARGIKRKCSLEPQSLNKRLATSPPPGEVTPTRGGPYARSQPNSETKRAIVNDTPGKIDHVSWPKYIRRKGAMDGEPDCITETREKCHAKAVTFVGRRTTLWRTRTPYYVRVEDDDAATSEDIDASASTTSTTSETETPSEPVLVPGFRVHKVPTGFSMEGTENLDDDTFLKRHNKQEQDERRRKRWDQQRARELSLYERLQETQRERDATQDPAACATFSHAAEEARYIEVCDELPVGVFGYPLLKVSSSEFAIPWFDLDKREQQDRGKSRMKR